ncbi:MAG: fibronectin type III domain-containing protein, partial [Candidatus Kapabacteria bacterium]|nr:fibronectin type III domain-containing protein [Candidatus Kapabacteria bacterium]
IPTGSGTETNINTNYQATGLAPTTQYEYYVRADCGDGTFSAWAGPFLFNTPQIPEELDYFEDFEDTVNWTLNNGTQANKWYVGTATNNGGTHSLYISNDNGVSNTYTFNSTTVVHAYRDIQMPAAVGEVYLSYDWKTYGEGFGTTNYDYFRVWVVPITFTPTPGTQITAAASGGQQFGGNHNNQANWGNANHTIPAAAYAGQIVRLVFEWRNDASAGNQPPAAIDNINVSVITCQAPSALVLNGVTINTADISWTGQTEADSYDYYYSTSNTPPGANDISGNTENTTVNLTGLSDSSTYYFWVRSNCGEEDGVSFWVGPIIFNTPQVPEELDYFEDFEDTVNWTLNNGTQANKWYVGTATNNGGTHSLYISNDNGVSNTYTFNSTTVVHAYRDIQMPAAVGEVYLSYDWKALGESSFDYFRVWVVPIAFTPTPGTQITAAASGGQQFGGNHNNQANWVNTNYIIPAAAYAGQIVRLVFEWRNDASAGNQPPAAIDNINVSVITCQAPSALVLNGVTINTADISWTGQTEADSYDYYYSTSNTPPGANDISGNTENTAVNLTGLSDSSTYYFWVRSNCGEEDGVSFWVGPIIFNTPQVPAPLNFFDDFEGNMNWTLNNGTQTNKWIVGTATSNGGTHSLYISDNGVSNNYTGTASVTHAYRDIQMPDVIENQLIVSYDWKALGESSFDYLRVWLVPVSFTPTPGTLITAGAERIQLGGNHNQKIEWTAEQHFLTVPQFAGQAVRLIFEWRNDGIVQNQPPAAVDNVDVRILTCPAPTDLLVTTEQGSLNVSLTWTPGGTETQWEVIILPSGSAAPLPSSTGTIVNDIPSFLFVAENDTLYEYYVRAICADDDNSYWAGPTQFSIFVPPGCAAVDVVGVGVEIIDSAVILCPEMGTDVSLEASFYGIAATTSYEVEAIDFAPPFPFTGGTVLDVTIDDRWSPIVDLPFNFCFFGQSYNKALVGSNGVVTFTTTGTNHTPNGWNEWQLNGLTIPNTAFPTKNAIYGVYQDTHPTTTAGLINYQVLGTYPCRALVVNFYELPQFNCGSSVGLQTSQIVIYEISNIIEVYIGNRTPCMSWPSFSGLPGQGVVGIQNTTGTQAYAPGLNNSLANRNTGAWSAQNEAWRFIPNGESDVDFQWSKDGEFYSNNQEITVSLTPEQQQQLEENNTLSIFMEASATYATCTPGEEVTTSKVIEIKYISSLPNTDPQNIESCSAVGQAIFDLSQNTDLILNGLEPSEYLLTYYLTEEDALMGDLATAIQDIENFPADGGETIWIRIADSTNSCFIVKSFLLTLGELTPSVAEFSYDSDLYCITGNNPIINLASGFTNGGVFSSSPEGLNINPSTGEIDLNESNPGEYEIIYEIEPNACNEGATHNVTIEIESSFIPIVSFSYDADEYCQNGVNPVITLAGDFTLGGIFSST